MVNKQTIYTCFVNIALLSHYRETVLEDKPTRFNGTFFIFGGGDVDFNWRHLYNKYNLLSIHVYCRLHCGDVMFSAMLVPWGSADTYEYSLMHNYYSSFLMNSSG